MTHTQLTVWAEQQPQREPDPPVLEILAIMGALMVVCFVIDMWVR